MASEKIKNKPAETMQGDGGASQMSIERVKKTSFKEVQAKYCQKASALAKLHQALPSGPSECPKCKSSTTYVCTGRGGNAGQHGIAKQQYQCKKCNGKSRLLDILTHNKDEANKQEYIKMYEECLLEAEKANRSNSKITDFFNVVAKAKATEIVLDVSEKDTGDNLTSNKVASEGMVMEESAELITAENPIQESTSGTDKLLMEIIKDKNEEIKILYKKIDELQVLLTQLVNQGKTAHETPQSRQYETKTPEQKRSRNNEKANEKINEKNNEKNKEKNDKKNKKTATAANASRQEKENQIQDGWHIATRPSRVKKVNTSKPIPVTRNTYANIASMGTYKPARERSAQSLKKTVESMCLKRTKPPIEVVAVYLMIQNAKPFIAASQRRDRQTQHKLMNEIIKHFKIGRHILSKALIGNRVIQLFIDKEAEDEVVSKINDAGGEAKIDSEFEAGRVPEVIQGVANRERTAGNIVNRAVHLYGTAFTRNLRKAVLNAYKGEFSKLIEDKIIEKIQEANPAPTGTEWILQDGQPIQKKVIIQETQNHHVTAVETITDDDMELTDDSDAPKKRVKLTTDSTNNDLAEEATNL